MEIAKDGHLQPDIPGQYEPPSLRRIEAENSNAVAVIGRQDPARKITQFGITIRDADQLWKFAQFYAKSGLAPKGMDKNPEACCIAMQLGMEVGMGPATACQSIAVINGRPSIWGDPQLGLVFDSGLLEDFDEWFEQDGKRVARFPSKPTDETVAVCRAQRKGYPPAEQSFSVGQAKLAGLWTKDGPWKTYPARMLQMRARAFALRDRFADVLKGLRHQVEELMYIDTEVVSDVPAEIAAAVDAATGPGGGERAAAVRNLVRAAGGAAPSQDGGASVKESGTRVGSRPEEIGLPGANLSREPGAEG